MDARLDAEESFHELAGWYLDNNEQGIYLAESAL